MAGRNGFTSRTRSHIVLIPGFGGFDALGQVEYYSGVTDLFREWRGEKPVVLHYFDNLPTAAVVTRAARLQRYLAKRMVRGEILEDDEVTLVGHSTGGLDIRQLVSDLHEAGEGPMRVDGGVEADPTKIRRCLRRVVFLSVPHWGTNIADWVRSYPMWRRAVVAELKTAVTASQMDWLNEVEHRIAGGAAYLTGAELLLAVKDALTEANEHCGKPSPQRTADAHEAASELALYLRHISSDFHVIHDLSSQPSSRSRSPAHFSAAERAKELRLWANPAIETLSYATVGSRPFRFAAGRPAPVWNLANPLSFLEILNDRGPSQGTDISYRLCYRACAGGPFRRPSPSGAVTHYLRQAPRHPIELWDNDGIVNTASMLWPRGENVLVAGDHLDIVGHYHLVEAEGSNGRKYRSYNSLKSAWEFDSSVFEEVWTGVFDFSIGRAAVKKARRAAAAAAS